MTAARQPGNGKVPDPVSPPQVGLEEVPLRVVLCGSFRRDVQGLRECLDLLRSQYEVLSPIGLDFVDANAEFVRLSHQRDLSEPSIEQQHLDALIAADFIWLHAPQGYLGLSAAFELGHAKSLGIPIFSNVELCEPIYRPWVHVVASPTDVHLDEKLVAPGDGLRALQNYYERIARRRGWADESAQDTLLLMTEEMGELARAVRKVAGLARDGDWQGQDVAEELADMQLYLVHLANSLGIEMADAVTAKEQVNAARAASRNEVA
jgi:NTP pyrophosphatase (non-canonical NTP hydrolase)